jgi:hypothetical protein
MVCVPLHVSVDPTQVQRETHAAATSFTYQALPLPHPLTTLTYGYQALLPPQPLVASTYGYQTPVAVASSFTY